MKMNESSTFLLPPSHVQQRGWDGMGVCPTPARHVARPTLCVSGLCHRLLRAGLGATQTTTDPVRDRRVKFPYPHPLGTLVGVTSGASGPHSRTHTHTHHVIPWS